MQTTNYNPLLSLALNAAVLAGKEIKKVYSKDFAVELKQDQSPLTEADKRSHNKIVQALSGSTLPVLSEEGKAIDFSERSKWKMFWMIDPLDGTKEFIKRNGEFTVNIALIKNGEPVMGVIYAPVIDALYFGCEGLGSFRVNADEEYLSHLIQSSHVADKFVQAGQRLPVSKKDKTFTVVASRSHMSDETQKFIELLKEKHGEVNLISKGSSLKLCLVAEGSADVYPRFAPTMEWDTAAGQAIARYAGFKVINVQDKNPMLYNKTELLNPWFIVE